MTMLDDLELELRKLPGVRAAGFDTHEDLLLIQLHVTTGESFETPLPVAATRIAARHSDRPVAVEVIRWRERVVEADTPAVPAGNAAQLAADAVSAGVPPPPPAPAPGSVAPAAATGVAPRARLLAVLSFPDTDELEVHLDLAGRRSIGRAPVSNGLAGAVEATLAAIRALGADIGATIEWVRSIDDRPEASLVGVCVRVDEDRQLYGMAAGASAVDSATRATLDALNRRISLLLAS